MIYISSSISNFKDKIDKKGIKWPGTLFIGLYHKNDHRRFIFSRGERTVFWCGSDILNLKKSWWRFIIKRVSAKHLCENKVEQAKLKEMGIAAEIHPAFFDDVDKFPVRYKWSKKIHVWMCAHPDRKQEYGVDILENIAILVPDITFHIYGIKRGFHELWYDNSGRIHNIDYVEQPNIIYHGVIPNNKFNEEIKNYHAGIRLNKFDGASEVMFKSILLGQWPITRIPYEKVDCARNIEELIEVLKELRNKKKPNLVARDYWLPKIKTF